MSQGRFRDQHEPLWQRLREALDHLDALRLRREPRDWSTFPSDYRRLAQVLALARYRRYSADLVDRLNRLALRGYRRLYGRRVRGMEGLVRLVTRDFPRAVRADGRLFWVSALVFFGPWLAVMVMILIEPERVYSVLDPLSVARFEEMYDPASERFGVERGAASDLAMFGYYIRNNVGIAFRTFAGGVLFGLGSLVVLLFNGLVIGAAMGHMLAVGYGETFLPFVVGHGAFELTAIVLAGMAGLKLGLAALIPGRRSRGRALQESAREALPLVYGFAGMLIIAAFIEAFWSSSALVPAGVKYAVGGVLWTAVYAYLGFAGRDRGP